VPTSEWGSYYTLDKQYFDIFFLQAFVAYLKSDQRKNAKENGIPVTNCDSIVGDDAPRYSHYYRSLGNPDKYLLVSVCDVDRRYEYIVTTAIRSGKGGNAFIEVQFIHYYISRSELGVDDAVLYEYATDSDTDPEELLAATREAISANLPDGCTDPTLNTRTWHFGIETKEENDLTYWRFPVACTIVTADDFAVKVEVFLDIKNGYVNNGEYGLAGVGGLTKNDQYGPNGLTENGPVVF
jgi:hypothetical protein